MHQSDYQAAQALEGLEQRTISLVELFNMSIESTRFADIEVENIEVG